MKKFLITKKLTAELVVECDSEAEARAWAKTIVVTLEDDGGRPIELSENIDFVADSSPADCAVTLLA